MGDEHSYAPIRGALTRAEIDALNLQAWDLRNVDRERAVELARLTARSATAIGYQRGAAQARVSQSVIARHEEQSDRALELLGEAIPALEPDGPSRWLAWSHTLVGGICADVGELERARHHYLLGQDIGAASNDVDSVDAARLEAAQLLEDPGQRLAALTAAEGALSPDSSDRSRWRVLLAVADALLLLERPHEALERVEQAKTLLPRPLSPGVRLSAGLVESRARALLGQGDLALELAQETMAAESETASSADLSEASLRLAEVYQAADRLHEALDLLTLLDERGELWPTRALEVSARLAAVRAALGDYEGAYAALRRHHRQRAVHEAAQTKRRVAVLEVLYRTREAEGEMRAQVSLATELDSTITQLVESNSSAKESALRDELTGLVNRRFLNDQLDQLAARLGGPSTISLALLDLDHFKAVNDQHGHLVGDLALREVGLLMTRWAPPGATTARLGGEEFVALLPGMGAEDARLAADDLRRTLAHHRWPPELGASRLTASIGVATVTGPLDPARLMRRADDALYAAKERGRNRVVGVQVSAHNTHPAEGSTTAP